MTTIAAWEGFAQELVDTSYELLGSANVTFTNRGFTDSKPLGCMLLSRTLLNLKGAIVLANADLIVETRTIARSCYENAFVLAALLARADETLEGMKADQVISQRSRAKAALNHAVGNSPAEFETKLIETIERLKNTPIGKAIKPTAAAVGTQVEGAIIVYRQLSADAAHPSIEALYRHVGWKTEEGARERGIDIVPQPVPGELERTIALACHAAMMALTTANALLAADFSPMVSLKLNVAIADLWSRRPTDDD